MPVLSKTTTSTLLAFSSIADFFTKIPFLAHNPSLITMARGVASPKAQGQAQTKTLTR